jgi:hypothetical protein
MDPGVPRRLDGRDVRIEKHGYYLTLPTRRSGA